MPTIKFDKEARAVYIRFMESDPANHSHCEEIVRDIAVLDRNKDGTIAGIEVLDIENIEDLLLQEVK